MPLYMDFHKFPRITLEEAKKAHMADEKIQKKYGVKYLQFWVNEGAGSLFCLVEGPDKRTCESVHRMAHGHIACAMVEVDPSYYALVMGDNVRVDQGVVHDEEGSVDLGYRSILTVTVQIKPPSKSGKLKNLKIQDRARNLIFKEISKSDGRILKVTGDDSLMSVFNSVSQSILCAGKIQAGLGAMNKKLTPIDFPLAFRIGLATGQPVTINNEFIEETIRLGRRLSQVAADGSMFLSSLTSEIYEEALKKKGRAKFRSLKVTEETFLAELLGTIDTQLADENFNIDSLVRTMGISRPQLYRKVHSLSGKAPNDLIRDLRLDKAMSLLKRKAGNIAEIAYEVGFSNPSYFAKCFAARFGCLPSEFAEIVMN